MIVVTTPTGQIGSQVARSLVRAGRDVRVVARDADRLDPMVRDGAEVVEGSHGDPGSIGSALAGADALFWLAPNLVAGTPEESFVEFTRPAVAAIREHRVRRVVDVTALGRGTRWRDDAGLVTASIAMDDLLMGSGADFRGLAMPSFMENVGRQAAVMKAKGMFFGPIDPDARLPWIATRDVAAAAVRWLGDDGWSGQVVVPVVGPDRLSHAEIASIISEVSGREIRYQQTSLEQFRQGFLDRGASEPFAQGYADMYAAKAAGMDAVAADDADGSGRTTFREWAEDVLKPALAG